MASEEMVDLSLNDPLLVPAATDCAPLDIGPLIRYEVTRRLALMFKSFKGEHGLVLRVALGREGPRCPATKGVTISVERATFDAVVDTVVPLVSSGRRWVCAVLDGARHHLPGEPTPGVVEHLHERAAPPENTGGRDLTLWYVLKAARVDGAFDSHREHFECVLADLAPRNPAVDALDKDAICAHIEPALRHLAAHAVETARKPRARKDVDKLVYVLAERVRWNVVDGEKGNPIAGTTRTEVGRRMSEAKHKAKGARRASEPQAPRARRR